VSQDAIIVFVILGVTIALFVSDRLRLDVVALLSLLALLLSGVISVEQGLAGFSSPLVLMIAGLFVIGSGLAQTGVAEWMGLRLASIAGSREARVMVVMMTASALLSAFMSSTGTVAVLLPVVVSMADRARLSPSRLLIPLAFASLIGGTLTLIGTPPNLVVSNQLREGGLEGFGFFSFTPVGVVLLLVGIAFMVLVGRRLLPGAPASAEPDSLRPSVVLRNIAKEYDLPAHQHRLRVAAGSVLVGQTLARANLRARFGVTVIGIRRAGPTRREEDTPPLIPSVEFRADDVLTVQGEAADTRRLAAELELVELPDDGQFALAPDESLAEVVVPRRSRLVGRSLREIKFRDRYRATILAIRRAGRTGAQRGDLPASRDLRLEHGDTLLLKGRSRYLGNLREERRDLVMVTEPRTRHKVEITGTRAMLAVAITVGMLVLMTFDVVPNVVAVLLAAVAMVTLGCLSAVDAYRGINWESVVLIAAILPMATALEKTGGMRMAVDALVGSLGGKGPYLVLAALFVLTSAFSQVISNTATAVLVAPVAFKVAVDLGFAPHAFLMTVAIAASTAFATPIASPVNTLVLNPGGYRFGDFFKVGLTLQIVLLAVTLLVVPLLFPL
jgi:di/tricarboxylate transporter